VTRRLAWGGLAVALYLLGATLTVRTGFPFRPLYDGQTPPAPYNWVDPPPDFAEGNQEPADGSAVIELTEEGSAAQSVLTEDTQAQVSLPEGAFPPRRGTRTVGITIDPVDPATLPGPPSGLVFDGNAYRFDATYRPSEEPADLRTSADVILRYPRHATVLLVLDGQVWTRLVTTRIPASLAVVGATEELGTFVAAVPPGSLAGGGQGISLALLGYFTAGAALLGAGLGWRARRRLATMRGRAARASQKRPKQAGSTTQRSKTSKRPAGQRPSKKRKGRR
jgi:hypothetical protein